MFIEKQSVPIYKGEARCPHCGATLTPSNKGLPLRYSGISLARVLIIASACAVLLWLFANPADWFLLLDRLGEKLHSVMAAALCVTTGFLIAYLAEFTEIKLLYWARKQRVYGFRCRACKKTYVGVKNTEKREEK